MVYIQKKEKVRLEKIEAGFTNELLKNINTEYEIVLTQFENKEVEIQKLREAIQKIENII